jgi:hypothetical protein
LYLLWHTSFAQCDFKQAVADRCLQAILVNLRRQVQETEDAFAVSLKTTGRLFCFFCCFFMPAQDAQATRRRFYFEIVASPLLRRTLPGTTARFRLDVSAHTTTVLILL